MEKLNSFILQFKEGFFNLLPKLIISLLILGLGYLLARVVKLIIRRLMGYINKLIKRQFKEIDLTQSTTLIETTFFWLILLFTFFMVADIFDLEVTKIWVDDFLKYIPNLIAAILIIMAAIILSKIVSEFILSSGKQLGLNYATTLGRIAQFFILLTSIIIAIDQIGVEVTFLINLINIILAALLFGTALAFGIGAKTSVNNILAIFYVRKMYKEGDHVKIGEIEGIITRIDETRVVLENKEGQFSIPAKLFCESKSFLINKNRL